MPSHDVDRRAVLATLTVGASATTGCLGLFSSGSSEGGHLGGTSRKSPSSGGPPKTDRNESETDRQDEGRSSAASVGACPSLPVDESDISRFVCDGKETDAKIHLSADQKAVSLPKGTLKFTLVNRSMSDVLYTPCRWAIYKRSDGGWEAIRPLKGETSTTILSAGITQAVTLTLYVGRSAPSGAEPCGYSLNGLDPGRYLFGVAGTDPEGKKTLFLASFRAEN